MVYIDPNNTNSIVYQHTLLSYQLKTSHWNISWAATLHLYNMADRGEKLQQPHCYHPFSDSRDTYLTKNHYENYSPKMVPTNPTGSWTNSHVSKAETLKFGKGEGISSHTLQCIWHYYFENTNWLTVHECVTYAGREKRDTIKQTTFSNSCSWEKLDVFWFNFYWNSFFQIQVQLTISLIGSDMLYWPGCKLLFESVMV